MLKYEPADVFDVLAATVPDGMLYEIVDNQVVEKKKMNLLSQMVGSELHEAVSHFAKRNKLGWFTTETMFDFLRKINRRTPDLAFVSYSRWPRNKPFKTTDGWEVIPEIVVEVISPSNTAAELNRKIDEYFLQGVSEIWIVDPEAKKFQILPSPKESRILTAADTLTCERFLPGLALPLVLHSNNNFG